jgi:hypothetical protein
VSLNFRRNFFLFFCRVERWRAFFTANMTSKNAFNVIYSHVQLFLSNHFHNRHYKLFPAEKRWPVRIATKVLEKCELVLNASFEIWNLWFKLSIYPSFQTSMWTSFAYASKQLFSRFSFEKKLSPLIMIIANNWGLCERRCHLASQVLIVTIRRLHAFWTLSCKKSRQPKESSSDNVDSETIFHGRITLRA